MSRKYIAYSILSVLLSFLCVCCVSPNEQLETPLPETEQPGEDGPEVAEPVAEEDTIPVYKPEVFRGEYAFTEVEQNVRKKHFTLAVDYLDRMHRDSGEGCVFSPLGLMFSLSMLQNGAAGDTRAQILSVLDAKESDADRVNDYCNYLIRCLLIASYRDKSYFRIDNAMFIDNRFSVLDPFAETLRTSFYAPSVPLPFSEEASVRQINRWSEKNTGGTIPMLFKSIPDQVKSILLNAMQLHAPWAPEDIVFAPSRTKELPFAASDGRERKVPMMRGSASFYTAEYDRTEVYEVASIPLYGRFAYQVYLPREGSSFQDMMDQLQKSDWDGLCDAFKPCSTFEIKMPRFELSSAADLNDLLEEDMGLAFGSNADFSRLANRPVSLDAVIQKSSVRVNEQGVVAAAVTMETAGDIDALFQGDHWENVSVEADHTFLFLIVDRLRKVILFSGIYEGE